MIIKFRKMKKYRVKEVIVIIILLISTLCNAEETWNYTTPVWYDQETVDGHRYRWSGDPSWEAYWGRGYAQRQWWNSISGYPPPDGDWTNISRSNRERRAHLDPIIGEREDWTRWYYLLSWRWYFNLDEWSGMGRHEYSPYDWSESQFFGYTKARFGYRIPPEVQGRVPKIFSVDVWGAYDDNINYYELNGASPDPEKSYIENGQGKLVYDMGYLCPGETFEAKLTIAGPWRNYTGEEIDDGTKVTWNYNDKRLAFSPPQIKVSVKDVHSNPIPVYPSLDETTDIKFKGSGSEQREIEIQDLFSGRLINRIKVEGIACSEEGTVEWDGKDNAGNIVGKGLYGINVVLKDNNGNTRYSSAAYPSLYAYAEVTSVGTPFNTVTFRYKVWGWDNPEPNSAKVYINLYDDEFRLIKRVLEGKIVPVGELQEVQWNYSAYSPGTYYYTIWAKDNRKEQAHIRGENFTAPEHTITGIREPYPEDMPGWDKEGPIVRVRRPAVVVASDVGILHRGVFKRRARYVASVLKHIGYKLVNDDVLLVNMEPVNDVVHKGIEASGILYFSGHGMPGGIGADPNFDGWHLFPTDVEVNSPYKFVFLDACQAGADDSFVRAFGTLEGNRAFLGWEKDVRLPWCGLVESYLNARGMNEEWWNRYFWDALARGEFLDTAILSASSYPWTSFVTDYFGLRIYGDSTLYLK